MCGRTSRASGRAVLIFGVGYTGERLAQRLVNQGWTVWGTSRAAQSRDRLAAAVPGLRLFANGSEALAAAKSEGVVVTHLVATAAPGEGGDPLLAELGSDAASELSGVGWICYLSTVGVYGDCSGSRVDESSPLNPKSKRATMRVEAEHQWASIASGQLWILRLPGIYGPGRGPLFKARSGEARRIVAPNGHVFSRVHVDDIVGATVKAMEGGGELAQGCAGGERKPIVLNVVDNEPAPGHEVSGFAFELLGKTAPPCTDLDKADLSAVARSFYEESRYVLNSRMRDQLGYQLIYPTFREGLRAQLEEEARDLRAQRLRQLPARALAALKGKLSCRGRARRAVVLVDNGSLKAESTIGLRAVARGLGEKLGASDSLEVIASSCRFSDRVDPGLLGGKPARTLLGLLRELREKRYTQVVLLPVFLGPSNLATEFIPKQVSSIFAEPGPPMPPTAIAPTLICNCPFLFPNAKPDLRIARILVERIRETAKKHGLSDAAVLVTDHGSPTKYVAACRDLVVGQVTDLFAAEAAADGFSPRAIAGCCMERRDGPEYDFNGSLLEDILKAQDAFSRGDVIVALMFLQPGKHAGEGGDIVQIIAGVAGASAERRIVMTDVIGPHPLLLDILAERAEQARTPINW